MPEMNEPEIAYTGDESQPMEDHRNPRRRGRRSDGSQAPEVGILVDTEPRHALDRLVLQPSVIADIEAALRLIEIREQLEAVWKLHEIQPQRGRCIVNFYGPPGTGKTRAALGIARRLGKPLYQVDYSAIVSKYLGDTAKHIALAFKQAAEADAVLFFDEADSLLSRRVAIGESCSTSINQNRNCLMQELDRFGGVVVMTTNLFGNYDEAILRRIARHIEFALPNVEMRERLFRAHLPNAELVPSDLRQAAIKARGFSGGDILNACLNAMLAASADPIPDNWQLSEAALLAEIAKIQAGKAAHSGTAERRAAILN
jgi:ATP-dependent 26S proteasome regulatory subunit